MPVATPTIKAIISIIHLFEQRLFSVLTVFQCPSDAFLLRDISRSKYSIWRCRLSHVAYTTMVPPLFFTVALARPFFALYSAFSGRLVSSARLISSFASS